SPSARTAAARAPVFHTDSNRNPTLSTYFPPKRHPERPKESSSQPPRRLSAPEPYGANQEAQPLSTRLIRCHEEAGHQPCDWKRSIEPSPGSIPNGCPYTLSQ